MDQNDPQNQDGQQDMPAPQDPGMGGGMPDAGGDAPEAPAPEGGEAPDAGAGEGGDKPAGQAW